MTKNQIDLRKSEAVTVKADPKQRIVVISDLHFGRFFDEAAFTNLKNIFERADLIIINGDLWDDVKINFDQFIKSKWSGLFSIMKTKTIYLFGNHDHITKVDERVNLFSKQQAFRIKLIVGTQKYHIEHGHLLSGDFAWSLIDNLWNYPRVRTLITLPLAPVEFFIKWSTKQKSTPQLLYSIFNTGFKKKKLKVSTSDEIFVMGHTHLVEYDKTGNFINLGFSHWGNISYLLIENGKSTLLSQ